MKVSPNQLREIILEAWENRANILPHKIEPFLKKVLSLIEKGEVCVVSKTSEEWVVNEWVKKAILLYFVIRKPGFLRAGPFTYFDKIELRRIKKNDKIRVVPGAIVRRGTFIGQNCIIMPSFINIGAHVGNNTMIDTWATVGSCAYVGSNVHISGGAGIGGVLEPPQARPVIIEDNCFIGSRCIITEGVIVRKNSVLGAGVVLTSSTKIIDTASGQIITGEIPENSVVIQGAIKKETSAGEFYYPAALIISKRTEKTIQKTKLNELLREWGTSL